MSYIFITFTVGIVSFILITEIVRIKQKIMDFIDKVQKLYESNDEIVDSIHKINGSIKEIDRVIEEDFTNVEKHNTEITDKIDALIEKEDIQFANVEKHNTAITDKVNTLIDKEKKITDKVNTLIDKEEEITNQVNELIEKEEEITNQVEEITNQIYTLIEKEEERREKEKIKFQIKKVAKRVQDYCEFFTTCELWSKNRIENNPIGARQDIIQSIHYRMQILSNRPERPEHPTSNIIAFPVLEHFTINPEGPAYLIIQKYISKNNYHIFYLNVTKSSEIITSYQQMSLVLKNECEINMQNFQETEDEYELRILQWLELRANNLYQKYKYYILCSEFKQ